MNVIAKISCYLERSVVTLKLRKEYLNSVIHTTSVLLWIKNWTVWYIERYSMSTYTGVTDWQKQSGFLAHPVQQIHNNPQRIKTSEINWAYVD